MLGPGGAVASLTVGLGFLADCLHAQQQAERTLRLPHHGVGLGAAFHRPFGGGFGLLGEAQAVFPLFGGGDVERGDVGLGGVGRTEGGDLGDGGMVSPVEVFRAVGEGWWEGVAQCADKVVVGVGREPVGEVGGVGGVVADMAGRYSG